MKNLIPLLVVVIILATGCPQPEPEIHQVEIGLFTPYFAFPEILNGPVKEVAERNYLAIEEDGKYVKVDRLTVDARDTIDWTNDFRLTFDEKGILLQSELIDENDELIDTWKLTVQDSRIVKGEYFKEDTLRKYMKLFYNDDGKLTRLEQYRMPVDTLIWLNNIISDENGNFLEWQFHDANDEPTNKFIFTVNQEDQRTGYKYYNAEGKVTSEQKYTYNDMGYLKKHVLINEKGEESVSEYEYVYDDMNNWVKVTGNSDEHKIITERTITYYEE